MSKMIEGESYTETENIEINSFEENFKSFVEIVNNKTAGITEIINMEELDNIKEELIEAKNYLESFANGKPKTIKDKALSHIVAIPGLGHILEKHMDIVKDQNDNNSTAQDVIKKMFSSFDEKQNRLIDLVGMAETLKKELEEQLITINDYIIKINKGIDVADSVQTKLRLIKMSNMANGIMHSIDDKINNKLLFIIDFIEQLTIQMTNILPVIRNNIQDETAIAGMANSVKDTTLMLNALMELSDNISRISSENIQTLIVDVQKTISSSGVNVEYLAEAQTKNEKFHKMLLESKKKHIEQTVKDYNTIQVITEKAEQLKLNRLNAEKIAIELNTKKESE